MMRALHQVDVEIDPPFVGKVDSNRLHRIALHALAQAGRAEAAGLAVLITGDDRIRDLNRQFRDMDTPTDVLSFSAVEGNAPFVTAPEAATFLGDIVISYPRAETQAQDAGHTTLDELDLLVVHGVLHLLGWEDDTEEASEQMWCKQQEILSSTTGAR